MGSIVRGATVYLFLLLIFRLSGKRALSQVTTFDLVLGLIISEAIQQALIDDDNSLTNALLLVVTLVGLDVLMSVLKQRSSKVEKLVDGVPLVIVDDGKLLQDRMDRERVDVEDVLEAARELQGVGQLKDVRYAVIERNGQITVVPRGA